MYKQNVSLVIIINNDKDFNFQEYSLDYMNLPWGPQQATWIVRDLPNKHTELLHVEHNLSHENKKEENSKRLENTHAYITIFLGKLFVVYTESG